jgi:murein DD-endopeptidase MepM/ murein hydrolase activator NlpD
MKGACRVWFLSPAALALAGCAAEGTTRILSYYRDRTGARGGIRPVPHEGVDFAASSGDPVIAAADGTVVRVFADGMYGNGIMVQHSLMRQHGGLATAIWTGPTPNRARR